MTRRHCEVTQQKTHEDMKTVIRTSSEHLQLDHLPQDSLLYSFILKSAVLVQLSPVKHTSLFSSSSW